jgi:hypothetical protein
VTPETGRPSPVRVERAAAVPVEEVSAVPVERSSPEPTGGSLALVDLLDRVLGCGVVVTGEVTLSIAGVDLVQVSLRALISSVRVAVEDRPGEGEV